MTSVAALLDVRAIRRVERGACRRRKIVAHLFYLSGYLARNRGKLCCR
jgi:hypothetical protein